MDWTRTQILRARAEHDALQRHEQLGRLSAAPKPGPDEVVSFEEAELLVQAHDYEDGEIIGLKMLGGLNEGHQVLRYSGGQVVLDAHHDRIVLPRDPAVRVGVPSLGWTSQAGRKVRRDEVAG